MIDQASSGTSNSRRIPLCFSAMVCLVWGFALLIGRTDLLAADRRVMSLAIVFDILVTVPVVFWLAMIRPGRAGWKTLYPIMVVSVAVMMIALPDIRRSPNTKWVFACLEPLVLGFVVWRLRQLSKRFSRDAGRPLSERLFEVLDPILPNSLVAELAATELTVMACALGFVRRPAPLGPGQRDIMQHRKSGALGLLYAIVFLALVETAVVHVLLSLWNTSVAWALTALSLYGAIWMLGYIRSLCLLPSRAGGNQLVLRNGLLAGVTLDRSQLRSFTAISGNRPSGSDYMALAPLGVQPTHLLELSREAEVHMVPGRRRRVMRLGLACDDPDIVACLIPTE